MTITLYSTNSPINAVLKSLSNEKQLTGYLRNECDILNPVIELEIESISDYNYLYIHDFGRYYFIEDITVVRTNLYRIKCRVDVLFSFREEIYDTNAIVSRSSTLHEPLFADSRHTFDSNNDYYVKKFGGSLNKNLSFILVVAGQN